MVGTHDLSVLSQANPLTMTSPLPWYYTTLAAVVMLLAPTMATWTVQ